MKQVLFSFLMASVLGSTALYAETNNHQHRSCPVVFVHVGAQASDESEPALNARLFSPVFGGADFSAGITEEFRKIISNTGCTFVLFESQDFSAFLIRKFELVVQTEGKEVIQGSSTIGFYRNTKIEPSAECKDMTKLSYLERLGKCYNLGGNRGEADETQLYQRGTTYFNEGEFATISEAIRDTSPFVVGSFILNHEEYADALVKSLGLEKEVTAINQSILMVGGRSYSWALLESNGYQTDIGSETLWKKTGKINPWAQKLASAGLFLNAKGLAWGDVNIAGNKIVKLSEFKVPGIVTMVGYDPDKSLTKAMKQAGFIYESSKWIEASH